MSLPWCQPNAAMTSGFPESGYARAVPTRAAGLRHRGAGRQTLRSAARQATCGRPARVAPRVRAHPIGRRTFLARKTNAKPSAASRSRCRRAQSTRPRFRWTCSTRISPVHREGHEHRQCPLPCRTDGLPSGTSEPSIGRAAGGLRAAGDRQSAASAAAYCLSKPPNPSAARPTLPLRP